MATLRHRQFAPTADVLELVYDSLKSADSRIRAMQGPGMTDVRQAFRDVRDAVDLLADIVDRHITAPDVEARVDGRKDRHTLPATGLETISS